MKEIGAWIRTYRMNKGLSLDIFSRLCGLSSAQVSRLETQKMAITIHSMVGLFRGLNMSIPNLLAELDIYDFPPRFEDREESDPTISNIEGRYLAGESITMLDLANYIQASRRKSKLSLRKLAEHTSVSWNAISRFERGKNSRVLFTEIVDLDKALQLEGRLIAIALAVGAGIRKEVER